MRKSKKIGSRLVRVLDELLDDPELLLAVACGLVIGDGITWHAVVDFASATVARNVGNPWDGRAILTPRRFAVERDVATTTILEVRRGVDALISTDAAAEGAGGTAGSESNITGRPLLPAVFLPPLGGRARAVHGVGTDTVTHLLRGIADTIALGRGEAVQAAKAAGIARSAYTERIVRISAEAPTSDHHRIDSVRCGKRTRQRHGLLPDGVGGQKRRDLRYTEAVIDEAG